MQSSTVIGGQFINAAEVKWNLELDYQNKKVILGRKVLNKVWRQEWANYDSRKVGNIIVKKHLGFYFMNIVVGVVVDIWPNS